MLSPFRLVSMTFFLPCSLSHAHTLSLSRSFSFFFLLPQERQWLMPALGFLGGVEDPQRKESRLEVRAQALQLRSFRFI